MNIVKIVMKHVFLCYLIHLQYFLGDSSLDIKKELLLAIKKSSGKCLFKFRCESGYVGNLEAKFQIYGFINDLYS